MRRSTIAIITIAIIILTIAIALIAAENAQYTQPITVKNGVAMVDMGDHSVALDTVNENDQTIPSMKITGYNAPKTNDSTPAELPNTSAPHGTHTCDMGSFTVTTDQACEDLK